MTNHQTDTKRFTLAEALQTCQSYVGGTTMVTLYITGKSTVALTISMLKHEMGISSNVKDRKVGKAVASALQSAIIGLQQVGPIAPPNGLAVFSGNTTIDPQLLSCL